MTESPHTTGLPDVPDAVAVPKSRRSVQLVWLIPLVAALIGGWLAVKAVLDRGPVITVSFMTAEGLEAGKTKLKYKDVEIGLVQSVALAADRARVIATAELAKDAKSLLVEDTRFWVVRPRISGGSVSGLSTLLSGSYIGVDVGKSNAPRREYTGLEAPPVFTTDAPGRQFVLRTAELGSLDTGSPVYFRRFQVGQIASYELDKDGQGVTLKVFVNAPYDQYVNANTRFWHASGIDVALDATGVKVETQSLISIVVGGLAFETPTTSAVLPAAEPNTEFRLYPHRMEAMKRPDSIADTYVMVFNESVRGLVPGAPVDFRGIVVGEVVSIKTRIEPATMKISLPVEIRFYPERMTSLNVLEQKGPRLSKDRATGADLLAARGLRGQLRTGNLLTGQLYIALDFFPAAPKAKINWSSAPPEFPTTPGTLEDLRGTVTSIAGKVDKLDFAGIGNNLQQTLQSTTKLMDSAKADVVPDLNKTLSSVTKLMDGLDTNLAPEARVMMEDARRAIGSADRMLATESPLQHDIREAMREITRAAQAFRVLADYLERHPEALIGGKKEDQVPGKENQK